MSRASWVLALEKLRGGFSAPAIKNLPDAHKRRVAVALDCAVVFGALEVHEACNASLADSEVLSALYAEKVEKLKGMA